jgi:hypothetical protein
MPQMTTAPTMQRKRRRSRTCEQLVRVPIHSAAEPNRTASVGRASGWPRTITAAICGPASNPPNLDSPRGIIKVSAQVRSGGRPDSIRRIYESRRAH